MWYLGLEDISINLATAKKITIEPDLAGAALVRAHYADGDILDLRFCQSYDEAIGFKAALFLAIADGVTAATDAVLQSYM